MLIALLAVLFVTVAVLWQGFFQKQPGEISGVQPPLPRKVELNTSIFTNPIFDKLQDPREAATIPPEVGRPNPFLPSF